MFNLDLRHTLSDETQSVNEAHTKDKSKVRKYLAALKVMANLADSMALRSATCPIASKPHTVA